VWQLKVRRDFSNVDFNLVAFSCTVYFTLSSYKLSSKFRELMVNIFKNERQAHEMKRILEIFPHGVIINPKSEDAYQEVAFSNKEFETQIQKIRNRVNELENITGSWKLNREDYMTLIY
jgi:rRNA maturation protein Rpf1